MYFPKSIFLKKTIKNGRENKDRDEAQGHRYKPECLGWNPFYHFLVIWSWYLSYSVCKMGILKNTYSVWLLQELNPGKLVHVRFWQQSALYKVFTYYDHHDQIIQIIYTNAFPYSKPSLIDLVEFNPSLLGFSTKCMCITVIWVHFPPIRLYLSEDRDNSSSDCTRQQILFTVVLLFPLSKGSEKSYCVNQQTFTWRQGIYVTSALKYRSYLAKQDLLRLKRNFVGRGREERRINLFKLLRIFFKLIYFLKMSMPRSLLALFHSKKPTVLLI